MKTFADNRIALHDFEILEKFSAGLELIGTEVKSIKDGRLNLRGSFVSIKTSPDKLAPEAWLLGSDIPAYQPKNAPLDYDARRERKLLLSKKELEELAKAEETKGLTIVPLLVYNKGRFIKIDIAIARGKKKFDKRQSIKKRDVEREIGRTLKR
jgi:SsrA-binding protein